ncbi:MAG: YidC/Oxa1 family membrane protein insertase [bacterium]
MFETVLVQPIYNVFVFLIGVMPGGSVGLAIIALTLLIRALFYPAFTASIRTQMGMQALQGELDDINTQYPGKEKAEERAKKTMELYKEHKVHPFAGFLALLVQIPVFIALYFAFFRQGLPHIAERLLYPFVHAPSVVQVDFFGLMNLLSPHNIMLSVLVVLLQGAVAYLSLGRMSNSGTKTAPEKQAAQRLQQQMMLYFLPALMGVVSYSLPAAVGLYFATTNAVSVGQEWLIRRQNNSTLK